MQNKQDTPALEAAQHHRPAQPPRSVIKNTKFCSLELTRIIVVISCSGSFPHTIINGNQLTVSRKTCSQEFIVFLEFYGFILLLCLRELTEANRRTDQANWLKIRQLIRKMLHICWPVKISHKGLTILSPLDQVHVSFPWLSQTIWNQLIDCTLSPDIHSSPKIY